MTSDDLARLIKLREEISRTEKIIAETELAPNRSQYTERALSALRYSLQVQKAAVVELEKQRAKST